VFPDELSYGPLPGELLTFAAPGLAMNTSLRTFVPGPVRRRLKISFSYSEFGAPNIPETLTEVARQENRNNARLLSPHSFFAL